MATLIVTQGLPASGKSTWAEKEAKLTGAAIVCRDDIRAALTETGWRWSPENEDRDVVPLRDAALMEALGSGRNAISADTNLSKRAVSDLKALAKKAGANIIFKRFDVSVEECIRRDALRSKSVGADVIRRMAQQHGIADEQPIVKFHADPTLPPTIICDLDGTLSLFMHKPSPRSPYDGSRCDQDDVNEPVLDILNAFYAKDWRIVYLSGRDEQWRGKTMEFLRRHHCPMGPLFMRSHGDSRRDAIVKRELFEAHVRGVYNVKFVLDDRNQVVKLWRSLGLTCLQVADGDF